jgi:ankyrin repeat protein
MEFQYPIPRLKNETPIETLFRTIPDYNNDNILKLDEFFNQNIDININEKKQNGNTVLMYSIICNTKKIKNLDIINYLLGKNSDVDVQNNEGDTALMLAFSIYENIDNFKYEIIGIINSLIEKTANCELQNSNGLTTLMFAAKCKNLEFFKILRLKKSNILLRDRYGSTALMHLVGNANVNTILDCVKHFIESNTNIDLQNKQGLTAIMIAAQNYNGEIFNYLLDNNANVDLTDKIGCTVLVYAQNKNNMVDFMKAREFCVEARKDFATNRFLKAIKNLNKSIILNGKNAIYYCKKSECYAKLSMWIESLADARKSLELDDSFNEAYVQAAIALKNLNKIDQGIAILKCGINNDSTPNPFENEKNLKMLTLLEEFENELNIINVEKNEKIKREQQLIEILNKVQNEVAEIKAFLHEK